MTKVVCSARFGVIGFSGAAMKRYAELKGYTIASEHGYHYVLDEAGKRFSDDDIRRDDLILVQVVEELGEVVGGARRVETADQTDRNAFAGPAGRTVMRVHQRHGDGLLAHDLGVERGESRVVPVGDVAVEEKPEAALVDSGYCAHEKLTIELVRNALNKHGLPSLTKVLNTHLHSDHCGGNVTLAKAFDCDILIPVAEDQAVTDWNEELLSYQTKIGRAHV